MCITFQGGSNFYLYTFIAWTSAKLNHLVHVCINLCRNTGFVGQDCEVKCGESLKEMEPVEIIYPEDINDCQEFPLQCTGRCLSIIFPSSTDFYGRITIYSLQVKTFLL